MTALDKRDIINLACCKHEEHIMAYRGNTPARRRANRKYLSESIEEIRVRVPKGSREIYAQAAADRNLSLNKFAIKSMQHVMRNDIQLADDPEDASSEDRAENDKE